MSYSHDASSFNGELPTDRSATIDSLTEMVTEHPMGAVLAAAAAGAGLIALAALAGRDLPPARALAGKARDTALNARDDLQSELRHLARKIADALPTKAEAQRSVGAVGDRAGAAWHSVLGEAQHVLREAAPAVQSAGKMAREHPVWTSVAIGALGALIGALLLRSDAAADEDDAAAPTSDAAI